LENLFNLPPGRKLGSRKCGRNRSASAGLADVGRKVTSTIPIVVVAAGDLEGTGLVASLRRPGGNVSSSGGIADRDGSSRRAIAAP
jgi:hypothetical protein